MSFRKVIPILIFLGGAILGKPLALGSVGLFAKAFLYFENGRHFSYGSVDWHEGRLIFRGIDLTDLALSLHAERLFVDFRARHLEVERPKIEVFGIPQLKKGGGDWTLEMREGVIAGGEEFCFSFEKTWRNHLGRLVLEKKGSRLTVEAIEEDDEIWVDADFHRFETDFLRRWIDLRGMADGRVHLVFVGNECKRGSAHLDVREAGYGPAISGLEGTLDWEGEVGGDFLAKSLEAGRIRAKLSNLSVQGSKGGIEEVRGNFSFSAKVGAKWEFEAKATAKGQEFPIHWAGRAFLHGARPHWAESELSCRGAHVQLKGEREAAGFRWKGEGRGIDAVVGTLIQSLASLGMERVGAWDFEKGGVDFEGEALAKEWNIALRAKDFAGHLEKTGIHWRNAEMEWKSGERGAFQFDGASLQTAFSNERTVLAEEWEGTGVIEQGILIKSHFEGRVEGALAAVVLTGAPGGFHLEGKGENGEIDLRGAWNERLDFEIDQGRFEGLTFGGSGWMGRDGSFLVHLDRFDGSLAPICRAFGEGREVDGRIESVGEGFFAVGNFRSVDWLLQARGEFCSGLGFYCPFFEKRGEIFSFDLRIDTPTWDLVRFYGTAEEGQCTFDPSRTHVLGLPVQVDSCAFDLKGLASLEMKVPISWSSLIAAAPLWFPEATKWISTPISGGGVIDLSYARDGSKRISVEGKDLSWKGDPVFFHCLAHEAGGTWHISTLQADEWTISLGVAKEGQTLCLSDGHAVWKTGLEAEFFGHLDAAFQFELHLPRLRLELATIDPIAASAGIPLHGLQGTFDGKGTILRQGHLEADFDFGATNLKAASLDWRNEGPIHIRYASDAGILFSGLDLLGEGPNLPFFACKIDFLQFDAPRSLWLLNHATFHLPPQFLDVFPGCPLFLMKCNPSQEIDFTADIECPSSFSYLSCFVKKVSLPIEGSLFPIQNLSLSFDGRDLQTHFELDHQGYPVKISAETQVGSDFAGRLVLEDGGRVPEPGERPLSIDWTYSGASGFLVHEVEGRFGGMEASFHALDAGTSLIGSARIDFKELCKIIPSRIAQVFTDLNMGKGYELKGKLFLDKGISFRGLFTGKQIDLFGYQLRTLLSQFEVDPGKVRLYDLKISDSAGMLKIDELVASAEGDDPWTISIPHLTILELRPSLLQKPGYEAQPAGPLVIREMKIDDFKGFLEESKTYTAKGSLSFINSFRREHTVFDIPSDLLGRIVGLDLELLIPACGDLRYELKGGLFHLTSLSDAFSEAQRSEFFLVPDPASTMDLDGNLHILVSMKQFVLFKLTESFQILVDGKLGDPQYHLQKKRRFLGL